MSQPEKRNAYTVLGLHKGATEDEIKQAYVASVKKYDPEKHTERFMIVQNAFDRLRDPTKRAREDISSFNVVPIDFSFTDQERADVDEEKLQQAIQMLEQRRQDDPSLLAQIQPKLIHAYFMRSVLNLKKKLPKVSMEDWQRILDIDPTQQRAKNNLLVSYCKIGYQYASHNLFDEAIEIWDKAARMNPDSHMLMHNLALACEYAGRFGDSMRYWSETIRKWQAQWERNPSDDYMKTCIIEAHRHQSDIEENMGSQEAPAPPKPEPQRNLRPPVAAPVPQQVRTHVTQPPQSVSSSPQTPSSDTASPRDELQRNLEILKLNPEDFDANFRVGHILIEQKKWPDAVAHLSELTKKFPRNIEVINALGLAQFYNQDVDGAFRTWQRGLKLDPKNFQIREALIKGHMMMGRGLRDKKLFVNALVHFKQLARYLPESDEVHYELGRTYHLKDDLRSAYLEYQQVLKFNPKHKAARTHLSEIKIRRG